jgi:hypothetical protein
MVEDLIGSTSQPVPSLQALRNIRGMLLKQYVSRAQYTPFNLFKGPSIIKQPKTPREGFLYPKAKPVFELPKWSPGLNFCATIVDFLEKDEHEYVLVNELAIDDLLYKRGAIMETMGGLESVYNRKLRWIHLPSNNVRDTLRFT